MAGLETAVSLIPTIQQGIGFASAIQSAGNDRPDQDAQALAELQERQSEQLRQAQENAAAERERIATQASLSEEERRAALKRATARQRALFGSRGVSAAGGSSEVVLLGLFEESEDERAERESLDSLRLSALDQELDQQQRINVLQQTQLQQRQRLNNAGSNSALDRVSSGLSLFGSLF